MPNLAQRSFAHGEISPTLYARTDLEQYWTALRTCRNAIVRVQGSVENRPGTEFDAEVADSSKRVRLVPFIFSTTDALVMEFGDRYVQFHQRGAPVVIGLGTPYVLTTPYVEADLPALQFVQSNDVVTIVHPSYAPRTLSRTSNTDWTLALVNFAPSLLGPVGLSVAGGIATTTRLFYYTVTAIKADTGEESLNGDIVVATNAAGIIAPTAEQLEEINRLTADITGLQEQVQQGSIAAQIQLALDQAQLAIVQADASQGSSIQPTEDHPALLSWTAVAGASSYRIFRSDGFVGGWGVIGTTTFAQFADPGLPADPLQPIPVARNPFGTSGNYPSAVGFYQQREVYANTTTNPQTVFTSRSADFNNFRVSSPVQDDDPVTFTLVADQMAQIRHILDLGRLVLLTDGHEWMVEGDQNGVLIPSAINPRIGSSIGTAGLKPIRAGNALLVVQALGAAVREMSPVSTTFGSTTIQSADIGLLSSHLLQGYSLVDWAYAQQPNYCVWAVRSDGTLLGLTYCREQQVVAWHRHDTDGAFENVCVIPEDGEYRVYVVVRRTIDGQTKRYVERFRSRIMLDPVADSGFMDSALEYDGRNAGGGTIDVILSGGTTWGYDETITCTATGATFTSDDIGRQLFIHDPVDGSILRFSVMGYTSPTVVTGQPERTVPVTMRHASMPLWDRAVRILTNLGHLEGKAISVFADGFVAASPNNSAYTLVTVNAGTATLGQCYAHIRAGLPYLTDIETLDIDTPSGMSLKQGKINVSALGLWLETTQGVWSGTEVPSGSDATEGLTELKVRDTETMNEPVTPFSGYIDLNIRAQFTSGGRVFIRQVDPVPMALLAAIPMGSIPRAA